MTVPCLSDNYAFLVHNSDTKETALFDAPEADPILDALSKKGWKLTDILLTHHHDDHIDGVEELRKKTGAMVIGAASDKHRLPFLDATVSEHAALRVLGQDVEVFDVSGHTINHIAFYMPAANAVFTGDSLMALGCGRLFEGTPEMMWNSLQKLIVLPPETIVCSGHEYTQSNARFALTIEPNNKALISRATEIDTARATGRPTVPSLLSEECATNPFLRAHLPELKSALGTPNATSADTFAKVRHQKDTF
nr:hydroxyacylglutathione hydrolase [Cochlodiniinecator piscidefendens]